MPIAFTSGASSPFSFGQHLRWQAYRDQRIVGGEPAGADQLDGFFKPTKSVSAKPAAAQTVTAFSRYGNGLL